MRIVEPRTYLSLREAFDEIKSKLTTTPAEKIPFSQNSLIRFNEYEPRFNKEYNEMVRAKQDQMVASENSAAARSELGMYISHFSQNLNNTIARGVFKPNVRGYYELAHDDSSIPEVGRISDLKRVAMNIIKGESDRINDGGLPLQFPSLQEVEAKYNECLAALQKHNERIGMTDDELEDIEAIFDEGRAIIKDIWDEIEFSLRHEEASSRRFEASRWGVRYVSTTGEEVVFEENTENLN